MRIRTADGVIECVSAERSGLCLIVTDIHNKQHRVDFASRAAAELAIRTMLHTGWYDPYS